MLSSEAGRQSHSLTCAGCDLTIPSSSNTSTFRDDKHPTLQIPHSTRLPAPLLQFPLMPLRYKPQVLRGPLPNPQAFWPCLTWGNWGKPQCWGNPALALPLVLTCAAGETPVGVLLSRFTFSTSCGPMILPGRVLVVPVHTSHSPR